MTSDQYDELRAAAETLKAAEVANEADDTLEKYTAQEQALIALEAKFPLSDTIIALLDALSHETERADLLQAAVLERTAERDALAERVRVLEGVHFGDPCVHCNTPHDEVAPGPCTGSIRISRAKAEALLVYLDGSNKAGWPTTLWVQVSEFITGLKAALSPSPLVEGGR
jgi:hypothetical protein